jgi:hypothetical protein
LAGFWQPFLIALIGSGELRSLPSQTLRLGRNEFALRVESQMMNEINIDDYSPWINLESSGRLLEELS